MDSGFQLADDRSPDKGSAAPLIQIGTNDKGYQSEVQLYRNPTHGGVGREKES